MPVPGSGGGQKPLGVQMWGKASCSRLRAGVTGKGVGRAKQKTPLGACLAPWRKALFLGICLPQASIANLASRLFLGCQLCVPTFRLLQGGPAPKDQPWVAKGTPLHPMRQTIGAGTGRETKAPSPTPDGLAEMGPPPFCLSTQRLAVCGKARGPSDLCSHLRHRRHFYLGQGRLPGAKHGCQAERPASFCVGASSAERPTTRSRFTVPHAALAGLCLQKPTEPQFPCVSYLPLKHS